MKRYEGLEAWQAAHQLVLVTYRVTKSFPNEEREFRRFLDIAVGSLAELAYIFQLVKDLELIELSKWAELDQARDLAGGSHGGSTDLCVGLLCGRSTTAHQPISPSAHLPIA